MFCKNCGNEVKTSEVFCKNCGFRAEKHSKSLIFKNLVFDWIAKNKKIIFSLLGILLIWIMIASLSEENKDIARDPNSNNTNNSAFSFDQSKIISSVVNIYCEDIYSEDGMGGSGTIITEDGMVITNSHIIPQDEYELRTSENGCMVVLPDPDSGMPNEIYWADPVVIPGLSDNYDLAFLEIYDVYEEDGERFGYFPRIFPFFDDSTVCDGDFIKLGEPIRIFGYPAISGGESLTITDGVVSSFPGDGLIITSAKISSGNSGGLAVDKNGCMIGIPSMVSSDEYESLGVIISNDLILEFSDELDKL